MNIKDILNKIMRPFEKYGLDHIDENGQDVSKAIRMVFKEYGIESFHINKNRFKIEEYDNDIIIGVVTISWIEKGNLQTISYKSIN
jgi:hypothetical protein